MVNILSYYLIYSFSSKIDRKKIVLRSFTLSLMLAINWPVFFILSEIYFRIRNLDWSILEIYENLFVLSSVMVFIISCILYITFFLRKFRREYLNFGVYLIFSSLLYMFNMFICWGYWRAFLLCI